MSTRGCIVIASNENMVLVFTHSDSYPHCLGRDLVEQISRADLVRWKQLAEEILETEQWFGPGFRLVEAEIDHIQSWISKRVKVVTAIMPEEEPDDGFVYSVTRVALRGGLFEDGRELARVLMHCLHHDPSRFFHVIDRKLNALLELGLVPRVSPRFLRSPFCQWVYFLDFDENVFAVGTAAEDNSENTNQKLDDMWKPSEDAIAFKVYSRFPLDDIPKDWEQQLEKVVTCGDEESVDKCP